MRISIDRFEQAWIGLFHRVVGYWELCPSHGCAVPLLSGGDGNVLGFDFAVTCIFLSGKAGNNSILVPGEAYSLQYYLKLYLIRAKGHSVAWDLSFSLVAVASMEAMGVRIPS